MAYSVVPTVATGDVWTAAHHNTYIRDNFVTGVPGIFTAKGDLAVASGPNAAGRLEAGLAESMLSPDPQAPLGMAWLLRGRAQVKLTSNYAPNSGNFKIPWQAENFDTDNFWSVGTPEYLIIPTPGIYLITANVYFTFPSYAAFGSIILYRNSTPLAESALEANSTGLAFKISLVWFDQFVLNDQVSINVTGSANITIQSSSTSFGITRLN